MVSSAYTALNTFPHESDRKGTAYHLAEKQRESSKPCDCSGYQKQPSLERYVCSLCWSHYLFAHMGYLHLISIRKRMNSQYGQHKAGKYILMQSIRSFI